ncbi:hypothetical protein BKA70DRAFT_1442951 [Coprinopsis sp. MPI-PUGE-AT-0042]|nr:hypothetical protein BKA70DRAFT_1442951 [Coprinopsis sp. MPI-PUGE-AT-0042]
MARRNRLGKWNQTETGAQHFSLTTAQAAGMDSFYSTEKAAKDLDAIAQARQNVKSKTNRVMLLSELEIDRVFIKKTGPRQVHRMMEHVDGHEEAAEAYLRVQGVVCDKLLPPRWEGENGKKARAHLRQAVTISGLGSPLFDKAMDAMEKAYMEFYNRTQDRSMTPWTPSSYGHFTAIDAYAKYFSHRGAYPDDAKEEFDDKVDPEGVLQALVDNEYFHGPDNAVDYMQMVRTSEGRYIYKKVDPVIFKIGDIVEITISLASFPTKDKKSTMAVILKSIMLLDNNERNKAAILRMRSRYPKTTTSNASTGATKRRATYDTEYEEAESMARDRMDRMHIE